MGWDLDKKILKRICQKIMKFMKKNREIPYLRQDDKTTESLDLLIIKKKETSELDREEGPDKNFFFFNVPYHPTPTPLLPNYLQFCQLLNGSQLRE